jgi:zinc finger protein
MPKKKPAVEEAQEEMIEETPVEELDDAAPVKEKIPDVSLKDPADKDVGFDQIAGELCPFCNEKTLTLTEAVRDIPFFGMCHIFSMDCTSCKYHKADVEAEGTGESAKYELPIDCEDDMKIRVIKSSDATVRIPYVGDIEPGEAANGYVTNVEGIFARIKQQVEHLKAAAEDAEEEKKCKNLLKKLTRIMWGQEKATLIIEDPSGNSTIISPKVKKSPFKAKKK